MWEGVIKLQSIYIYTHVYMYTYVIEKNEVTGACSAYGGEEEFTGFWWGNLKERDHWGDPALDGKIILRWIFRKWDVEFTYVYVHTYI